MSNRVIKIGGASGFWGDAARATSQLLASDDLDFIVYDYLAEITMSIMARARAKDAGKGYALDFVTAAMAPNLKTIAEQNVKVISNAGGVNPLACAAALRELVANQGLSLKVACVVGDDLLDQAQALAEQGHKEMFSGDAFPPPERLQSINAYLGAFPIVEALANGADIVVTGRSVDSAVTLAACIHSFGWQSDEWDKLAAGSLAGHILECGPQATGGNFTDWELAQGNIENIGYPIAEVDASGEFVCTKPEDTGGLVSVGTVAEQMLYEIGDPQAYLLPDVSCDFSQVEIEQVDEDRVKVRGAKGRPATDSYKVCATYADQFRGGTLMTFYGVDAEKKAQSLAQAIFRASRNTFKQMGLADFSETSIELIGAESQYGEFAEKNNVRELAMKIAAKHPDAMGIGIMLREATGLGLATPPGLCGFQGGRPKPSPVVRLFSFELDKNSLSISIDMGDEEVKLKQAHIPAKPQSIDRPSWPELPESEVMTEVPLIQLAWGRSGDKGNKANVGIIARKAEYLPFITQALSEQVVGERFAHFIEADDKVGSVHRYLLPGSNAINFLIDGVLGGGGVASIRSDAQGKGYAQLLLATPISISQSLL